MDKTKRRPRSPPGTSNLRPRAGVAGPCLPTLPSPLSLRPRSGAPGRSLPTRYHAAAINRVEHPRFGVDLASGVVDARAKHPATSMPEEGAATRHQHVGIVPLQIQRTPTWSTGSLQMDRPALVGAHSCTRRSSRISLRCPERCPVDVSARPGGAAGGAGRASENQPRSSSPARFVPR